MKNLRLSTYLSNNFLTDRVQTIQSDSFVSNNSNEAPRGYNNYLSGKFFEELCRKNKKRILYELT